MKIIAKGATDVALIVLFWCNNMPRNVKELIKNGSIDFAKALQNEGKLIEFPMHDDGDYTVALYINEPVDDHLNEYLKEAGTLESVLVSGEGYFGGGEFMTNDFSELAELGNMCQKVSIPEGSYKVQIFEVEDPLGNDLLWLEEHCTKEDLRVWNSHSVFMSGSIFFMFFGCICFLFLSWLICVGILLVAGLLMFLGFKMMGSDAYSRVKKSQDEYVEAYPSCAVTFSSIE